MIDTIRTIISTFSLMDIIDIVLVSFLIYRLLLLIKGTKAIYMVVAIFLIFILLGVSHIVGLRLTSWILDSFYGYLFLIIIIIFQPEVRRTLALIGESRFFRSKVNLSNQVVDELVRTATIFANKQLGALILIQRNTQLSNYVQVGQKIDSLVSKDLLLSIFIPYSPLHDGAVIIEDTRLTYASCILPLTKRDDVAQMYGTRHRAAIGITEETDAIAIVVSEERGAIAVANAGKITSELDAKTLKDTLANIFNLKTD